MKYVRIIMLFTFTGYIASAQTLTGLRWNAGTGFTFKYISADSARELRAGKKLTLIYFIANGNSFSTLDAEMDTVPSGWQFIYHNGIELRIISDPKEQNVFAEATFHNTGTDTISISDIMPFGRDEDDIYITGQGDDPLARTRIFRPGRGPVGVIVPDNAWELGYHDMPLTGSYNLAALARRKDWKNATRKRFETRLNPGGEVTYTLYAELYRGAWQNGLRKIFQERKLYDLDAFDRTLYKRNDLAWIRHSYIIHLFMAWDHQFYDRNSRRYSIYDFVKKSRKLFGGDDVIGIWPTWPTLGLDQRNQFDLYRDLPGGLPGLKKLSDSLKSEKIKFFISYNPWDESTRYADHLQSLTRLISDTDADGVVLDTRGNSSRELQQAADEARPGVIMYSEGMAVPEDMPGIIAGRVHNALYHPPLLNLNKLIEPDFAIFRVAELTFEHIPREYKVAFFNGYGTEINVFRPGQPSWVDEEYKLLGKTTMILRENSPNFLSEDWVPLISGKSDSIYVNEWPSGDKTLYTIFSLVPGGYNGELFETDVEAGKHWVDLWNNEEIYPGMNGNRNVIPVRIHSFDRSWLGTNREGSAGCVASLPEILKIKRIGDSLFISTDRGSEIRIWKGDPSYDKDPLVFHSGNVAIKLMQHFGRYEGKIVVQLFDRYLLDERIFEIKPGTPRMISQVNKTRAYKRPPQGMVRIPAGSFIPEFHNPDEFIFYPEYEGPSEITMPAFYMDKYPVTNREFQAFLESSGYEPSDTTNFLHHWTGGKIPSGREDYPVVYISYEDAQAYASWSGRRLPTEIEWQYAAQTEKGNVWPWGMKFDSLKCNPGNGIPDPVGKYPHSANPYGLQDLVGNVWQITNDIYDSGSYRFLILKGGCYYRPLSSGWYVQGGPQPLMRRQVLLQVSQGFERNATVGFRCVADAYR